MFLRGRKAANVGTLRFNGESCTIFFPRSPILRVDRRGAFCRYSWLVVVRTGRLMTSRLPIPLQIGQPISQKGDARTVNSCDRQHVFCRYFPRPTFLWEEGMFNITAANTKNDGKYCTVVLLNLRMISNSRYTTKSSTLFFEKE